MTVHVFVGPTLDIRAARQLLPDATFLPPVSQGDVLRSATRRPTAIGIIDGRFHDVPAVWHKEILWALSRGIPVYGSASMGALRAAELAPYGMRGVGKIFEAYHSGLLNDDDEVAVAHGDADTGPAQQRQDVFTRGILDGVDVDTARVLLVAVDEKPECLRVPFDDFADRMTGRFEQVVAGCEAVGSHRER